MTYLERTATVSNASSKKNIMIRNWALTQIKNDAARKATSNNMNLNDTVANAKLALAAHKSLR